MDRTVLKKFGFKVVFDVYSPRAHLIILRENNDLYYKTNPLDSILQIDYLVNNLIELCIEIKNNDKFNDNEMKLTFHTGSFSKCNEFHAHFCINTQRYLRLLNETNVNFQGFKPTRQWIIKPSVKRSTLQAYILNVKSYQRYAASKYFNEYKPIDLLEIRENCKIEEVKMTVNNSNVSISYHEIHPKIQFKLQVNNGNEFESYCQLLKSMTEFGIKRDYFGKTKGSHMNINMNLGTQDVVTGYIFVMPDEYYQLLPEAKRRQWLDAFRKDTTFYPE